MRIFFSFFARNLSWNGSNIHFESLLQFEIVSRRKMHISCKYSAEERTALQTLSISWPKILHISQAISIYFGESSRWKWIAGSCLNFGDLTNCKSWSPKNNSSYKMFIFDYFWQYDFYPCKIISACMIDRISIIPPRNYLRCSSSPFLYPRFYILACLSHFSSVW